MTQPTARCRKCGGSDLLDVSGLRGMRRTVLAHLVRCNCGTRGNTHLGEAGMSPRRAFLRRVLAFHLAPAVAIAAPVVPVGGGRRVFGIARIKFDADEVVEVDATWQPMAVTRIWHRGVLVRSIPG